MGTVKGKIDILINEEKTQVCLDYTPRDVGENWSVQKVLDLLERSGITHGVNRDHIQKALTLFEQKKEKTQSGVVAQGINPLVPISQFAFTPKELNPELKKILKLAVAKAGPPPFNEKVNPEVKGVGYFTAGERAGKLVLSGEMIPGTDVYGKKIAPAGGREDSFLLGKGLDKSPEGELTARVTGIVRQGENWLDLIPFEGHSWDLSVNADQSCIYLDFRPGKKIFRLPPPGEILKEARERIDRDDKFVSEERIRAFLEESVKSKKPAQLNLTAARDAVIEIRTDASLTEASLYLRKGQGEGKPLSLKEVSRRVNESGLKGVDTEKIGQEIMGFYKSPALEKEFPLCQGKKPERGKDRSINFLVHFMDDSYRELLLDKVELDPSLVSFYPSHRDLPLDKIQKLANVEKGQKIFNLSNDGKGKSGIDVYGKEIPGLSGNDPILNLYENIEYRNGGGTALISGLLEVWWDREANILQGRIREHTNAPVKVTISANKMQASISIGLPVGTGFPADRNLLEAALKSAGVVDGLLEEKIDEAAEASGLGEVVTDMVVAEGKFPLDESQELKLVHDIDFRDKSRNSVSIKAGEDVGYLVSSGEREGFTVTGEAVESQADEGSLEIGENIEQNETDEQDVIKLTAGKSGRLIFTGNRLFIQDTVLITGDFSPNMGQLNFPGDVQVKGSVLSKAIINSGENISVNGVIQAALVSADKSVSIDKGIKGSGKAVIRGNLISFDYAEEAHLMAAEEIRCRKAMMRCEVRCNGRIS
ncbi:MAG: DUF342 domain-containing protein, partial [Spirochaetales bacterium]|nr:DUF342 domain-containing protein [Spirochaetales bacterium]